MGTSRSVISGCSRIGPPAFKKETRLMFAKGSSNDAYHLLRADEEQTLCGRIVAPIIIDQPVKSPHLHLTTTRPANCMLCESCAALGASVATGASAALNSL